MAAKKKIKSKATPKRSAPKPKSKAQPKAKAKSAPKRAAPKAKAQAVSNKVAPKKKVPVRAAVAKPKAAAKPQPPIAPAPAPQPIAAVPPPTLSIVRPGLQKRADAVTIGVVMVTDGDRLIEESTFYSTAGRDEYVRRWEARGYSCRFIASN
jgi:hypothetical protein